MKELRFAWKQTIPILFTYLFIGIAFGVQMAEAGYSAVWSVASGLFIYAGSLQIVMVSLLQANVSLLTMAVITFFLNARHIFYGIAFIDRFRKMGWRYPYMVLTLTDETYSILCSVKYDSDIDGNKTAFYIAMLNHVYWMLGCLIGGCMGQMLPWDMTGIDFSATAFFLVVVINQWEQCSSKIPAWTGLICSLVFYYLLGPDGFLIPALSASMITLAILRGPVTQERSRHA